ncbi:hypothetical protein CANTEDRAFT_120414 [Yamadazyma tenuis ATCC 10573]|uniref:Sphingoid long-chain base transporter RSB1 n=1 Tax=Candida tenuis (strain ATCC 10573 / BCRC 21748 / CBS 615 / JCM 9827 / NBRC 10315 / NRRL Y-1498 / VKM Y-70) TaxID=590646 RepID=G3B2C1_CANTC|nr:uncharacterized protein CANTEDRAFT_120414 [Yamadazyma tenuis ATCC 10573]EGV64641.1 hypothetical protein CANTEDRAFT_120414 [Yamadazyma tenuis ATCC 10573]
MSIQLTSWTTTPWPSTISTRSVDASYTSGLLATLSEAAKSIETATDVGDLVSLSRVIRGAEASLAIISAENAIATATESSVKAAATKAIFASSVDLEGLFWEYSFFDFRLNRAANIIYLTLFGLLWLYYTSMFSVSRYQWFNVSFFCGYTLEFIGFIGRILAFVDATEINYFLLEFFVALTLAPAFIMAGIYFLFAQMVVIHGREYSLLKPLWYSYFFISTDVLSLLVQAGGGASASIASKRHKNTKPGTDTIICGIVIQTVAMTVFLGFWFEFLNRVFFRHSGDVTVDSSFKKKSVKNFFKLLFNVKSTRAYKQDQLDPFYNPRFQHIRNSKLFGYMPLVITITVVVIYIRCIYRVVELSEGWRGYLITHEVYIMVLDALMVAIAGLVAIPFHPVWTLGRENVVRLATIRKRHDESSENQDELTSLQYSSNEAPVEKTVTAEKGITEVVLNKADNEVIADKK